MRINNWRHVPWIVFVLLATIAACVLYAANFHPDVLPAWLRLPPSLIQKPTEHHTVGGTPLGLWFGSISLAIFLFAVLLSLRKKIPLWRVGTVQRWLRAHIWLTILTIPLVVLHSGFRFGGPMTTVLVVFYAIVMVSGFYGLFLQHVMPRMMKERLPAETVFEQIPHIRAQLAVAAEKMRDSFKPTPPKKADAGAPAASATKTTTAPAPVMASTKGELSTPAARAKSVTGSAPTAAPVVAAPPADAPAPAAASIPNAVVKPAAPKTETIGTPTARVQSDPPGAPVARSEVPAGDEPAPSPPVAPPTAAPPPAPPTAAPPPAPPKPVAPPAAAKPAAAPAAKPAAPAAAKPAAPKPPPKPAAPADPASEAVLVEFIERQILPYLKARRGDRMRLNNPRFSDDTFRFVKLRVAEGYRARVEEIQAWCDERRMLDLQVRLQHWLHGWLFVHVPFSFLLVMLTIWHAVVTLFYY
ncbi:MAG TPA: hypothetical protein VGW57_08385 [Chthoniobacterales bacterium]|nr:hypothetical protein [Chthoniobacterales bacterium]